MSQWKYTRERLAKNEFCGAIINERAVFCICGQKVLLDKDYNESRLIEHSKNSRCKLNNKKRQLGLPGLFPILPKPKKQKTLQNYQHHHQYHHFQIFQINCALDLFLKKYVYTLTEHQLHNGGARRREFIGKDLFPDKFSSKSHFNSKKLNEDEMIQLNQQIIAKSEWVIDRFGIVFVLPFPIQKNVKHIPKFYYNNNPLLTYLKNSNLKQLNSFLGNENSSTIGFWLELADKATQGAFEQKANALHYKGPVVAMTDCTKLKAGLQYSSNLGCIVGSTLDRSDCMIETYDDIYDKVSNIKQRMQFAKDVPLSKFPPVIVAIIPTRGDNAEKIFCLPPKLLDIAARLEIHIISIGSDGAAAEFQAQNLLQATKTSSVFSIKIFNMNPKYRKKTAKKMAVMSGARVYLVFGNSTVKF
ncbi:unnamed protein product [Rhizophagus irregularis]|nr:unnamed protein product [Rhizophagus irregularis]